MWEKIKNYIDKLRYTSKLKPNIIYENIEEDVYFYLDLEDKVIKVYCKGTLINIPMINVKQDLSNVSEINNSLFNLNIHNLDTTELKKLLEIYEQEEDFENCKKIKELLDAK